MCTSGMKSWGRVRITSSREIFQRRGGRGRDDLTKAIIMKIRGRDRGREGSKKPPLFAITTITTITITKTTTTKTTTTTTQRLSEGKHLDLSEAESGIDSGASSLTSSPQ